MKHYKQLFHYADNLFNLEFQEISTAVSELVAALEPKRDDGGIISFKRRGIYGSMQSPLSSDIESSMKGAVPYIDQRIYHMDTTEPNYPSDWVNVGGVYTPSTVNVIISTCTFNNNIEYHIL